MDAFLALSVEKAVLFALIVVVALTYIPGNE